MFQKINRWLLYKVLGWKLDITIEHPQKYIICLAPHTSNWDFIIGQMYAKAEGMKSQFLMKKEWFFWPFGILFKHLGGIPVWRSKHTSMTDRLADLALQSDSFQLCVTPEGTRSRTSEWKKGFYFIAQKAGMPILLYGLDYATKTIHCTKIMIPSGDVDKDMQEIKLYFKDFQGKNPGNFTIE